MRRYIICGGGLRCGSTLQYNLIGEYLERADLGRRLGYGSYSSATARHPSLSTLGAVKTHPVDDWGPPLASGEAVGISTYRVEEGVRASMRAKFGNDERYEESEAYRLAWLQHVILVQDYDLLTKHPHDALRELCGVLEIRHYPQVAEAAVSAAHRDALKAVAARQAPGTWDPVTLIHHDHFKD